MSMSVHGQPNGRALDLAHPEPVPLRTLRVLIVEDQAIIALDLEARLRDLGHRVIDIVHTGHNAIKAAATHRPDLVLINVLLSDGVVGVNTAMLIRERFGIRSIFITAEANPEVMEQIAKARPIDVLVKPIFDQPLAVALLRASVKLDVEVCE